MIQITPQMRILSREHDSRRRPPYLAADAGRKLSTFSPTSKLLHFSIPKK